MSAHAEGPGLPLQDDARLPGAPEGRLGHARPAGGNRGGEAARLQAQGGYRSVRRRGVQPANAANRSGNTRPTGNSMTEQMGYWVDLTASLRHVRERLHRIGLVGPQAVLRRRDDLQGVQDPALLSALRNSALVARSLARLRGRQRPERVRAHAAARVRPIPRSWSGRPLPGRSFRTLRLRLRRTSTT